MVGNLVPSKLIKIKRTFVGGDRSLNSWLGVVQGHCAGLLTSQSRAPRLFCADQLAEVAEIKAQAKLRQEGVKACK